MTEVGVHPAMIDFIAALERGEKVVYHWSMHYLYCFAADFDPQEQYLSHWVYPGMHELLYPLFERERGVIGISFTCLQGLLHDTDLLTTKDKDNNLAANEIFECGIRWMETKDRSYMTMNAERRETTLADNEKARAFLIKANIVVPFSVWSKALPKPMA